MFWIDVINEGREIAARSSGIKFTSKTEMSHEFSNERKIQDIQKQI